MTTLSPQQWLALKSETRQSLEKIFRISKSSFTHVVGDRVESDGHTYEDLKAISLEEMRLLTHLDSEDFFEQFNMIIKMVEADGFTAKSYQENAISNEFTATAGINSGTKEGINQEAPVSQEATLPVSGGVNDVDRGSNEPMPDIDNNNKTGMATEDANSHSKKPKISRPN